MHKQGHTIYGTAFYFGEILGKRRCKTVPFGGVLIY